MNNQGLAFAHPSALVYGKVEIGKNSSLWPYSVIRAENHYVQIGECTNIQDFVMIHVGMYTPTIIGDFCSIAHRAVIHGATIGNNTLVGIGAIIMDGCEIGDNCIIGAGAFLKEKTKIPSNSVVTGNPARVARTRNNAWANKFNAQMYFENAIAYTQGNHRVWEGEELKSRAGKMLKDMLQKTDAA